MYFVILIRLRPAPSAIPLYVKLTDSLRAAVDEAIADESLSQEDREILHQGQMGQYHARESHCDHGLSVAALRVLCGHLNSHQDPRRLSRLLRGSSFVFPKSL